MLRQEPDPSGCISVDWPSRNVPHGGIFHVKKAEPSNESAQFLKVLLEESKLAIQLRKKSAWSLRQPDDAGGTGPGSRDPVSQYREPPRPHTSRRRSLSCIRESGALDVVTWRPVQRGEDREILKRRLQELMEWGNTALQKPKLKASKDVKQKGPKLPTAKDIREELLTQIRERAEWLEEMEALGHAAPHRELIHDQIAERMRSLAALKIGSECGDRNTARSSCISTSRSGRAVEKEVNSAYDRSTVRTGRSTLSNNTIKQGRSNSAAPRERMMTSENVSAYEFTPLKRSPRRRS